MIEFILISALLIFGFIFMFFMTVALCYGDRVRNGIDAKKHYSKIVNEVANGIYKENKRRGLI